MLWNLFFFFLFLFPRLNSIGISNYYIFSLVLISIHLFLFYNALSVFFKRHNSNNDDDDDDDDNNNNNNINNGEDDDVLRKICSNTSNFLNLAQNCNYLYL